MSIQFKTGFTMCATVAAGLCLAGCRTIHSDRSANRARPAPAATEDTEVRPTPPVLDAEPVKAKIHTPAEIAKESPWYLSHGEVSEKPSSGKGHAAAAGGGSYVVQKGDIAGRIASRHGVSLSALKAANPGKDLNKIKVGQTLVIPAKSAAKDDTVKAPKAEAGTYIVKKGDILGRIARQHGVKLADLKAANGLTSDNIKIGQKLVIPGKATGNAGTKTDAKQHGVRLDATADTKGQQPMPPPMPVVTPAVSTPAVPPTPKVEPEVLPIIEPAPIVEPTPAVEVAPVTVTPVAVDTASPAAETHTVVAGEDLLSLAIRWSISPEEIKRYNNLGDAQIKPGDILKIPPRN